MPEDANASPQQHRPKVARTNTGGVVRGRQSPPPGGSGEQSSDGRPPTKRARKAINCEPCRNSKLKCDRNRPCSSCVLRGTAASCYQDARAPEGSDAAARGDDHQFSRIDPAQEIARLRHSISLLEAYIQPTLRSNVPQRRNSDASSLVAPKKEYIDLDVGPDKAAPPGMLGSQVQGGLYAGPTSAATHLLMNDARESDESESRHASQDRTSDDFPGITQEYDRDLLALLPSVEIIDGLIAHYFEYCNWIYRHVNEVAFKAQWEKYKSGAKADRIVLSTACSMMSIATHYLPGGHPLMDKFQDTTEETAAKFFEVSTTSLQRRNQETRQYTLDLVELLLCRTHFHTLSKADSEEIWNVRGELITIATAMGLHRDPGKWRMARDVAERRRWAWWHIILLERWQAFLFGRPISIAAHHFDTQLPSYVDPALDKTARLYLPNIALFRLAFILGDIIDDAVSVRPVPYENVQANDRALKQWMENLPKELDLDEYRVARSLASDNVGTRRLGVQSVIIRSSYYHIRFTLHRPYASPTAPVAGRAPIDPSKTAQSLEIAVGAADKLITMVGQSRPDFMANSSLAVPGHMNWGPFHCFTAAMFFSFQLISNPDQPGAGLFRASIRKAISTLEQCRGIPVADKASDILNALSPLYNPDFNGEPPELREKKRAQVLSTVRKLAFPYHDSHDPRRFGDASPAARAAAAGLLNSPAGSSSVSPPMHHVSSLAHHYDVPSSSSSSLHVHSHSSSMPSSSSSGGGGGSGSGSGSNSGSTTASSVASSSTMHSHSSMRTPTGNPYPLSSPTIAQQQHQQAGPHSMGQQPSPQSAHQNVAHGQYQQQQVGQMSNGNGNALTPTTQYVTPYPLGPPAAPQTIYPDVTRYSQYVQPVDHSMWGAAIGFDQGEWSHFLDHVGSSMGSGRGMQGP